MGQKYAMETMISLPEIPPHPNSLQGSDTKIREPVLFLYHSCLAGEWAVSILRFFPLIMRPQ